MPDMKPNLPLLRKCVEWVEVEATKPHLDSEWDQETFFYPADERSEAAGVECGTAYCVAGYACHIAGEDVAALDQPSSGDAIPARAAYLLGLTVGESEELFAADNDATDVRAVANRIAVRAGQQYL